MTQTSMAPYCSSLDGRHGGGLLLGASHHTGAGGLGPRGHSRGSSEGKGRHYRHKYRRKRVSFGRLLYRHVDFEPAWLPGPGPGPATQAGRAYLSVFHPGGTIRATIAIFCDIISHVQFMFWYVCGFFIVQGNHANFHDACVNVAPICQGVSGILTFLLMTNFGLLRTLRSCRTTRK